MIITIFFLQNQPTENLIKDGPYRKWRCKSSGEQKAWVELQLEKTSLIAAVDIGNHGSAFIEILVGRSGCSDDDYKVHIISLLKNFDYYFKNFNYLLGSSEFCLFYDASRVS